MARPQRGKEKTQKENKMPAADPNSVMPRANSNIMPSNPGSVDARKQRVDKKVQRFRPGGIPSGTVPPPSWEPGIVEVQFKEGIVPQLMLVDNQPNIRSSAAVELNQLNQILQKYHLIKGEKTFITAEHEATDAQAHAQRQGVKIPNLSNFVTLHFPPDADVHNIAKEITQLQDVERAVPIPRAAPPASPFSEPLVGTSDQVLTGPDGMENQWYVYRTGANNAWNFSSGNGVVIADIDWEGCTTHEDLRDRLDLTHAYNAYDGGTNVSTGGSIDHGTGVMALAGSAVNDLGMSGIAFDSSIWPIQADSGPGSPLGGNEWARAIDWVRTADSGGRRKVIILEVQTFPGLGNYEQVPSVNGSYTNSNCKWSYSMRGSWKW